ncbi:hypothetical protein CDCA_CDCA07G2163 [Cyanidium caldarium]|uniref:Vacuolar protein sorting-associated protein n=1 Tax=Cyanidium caldarium TaxID=2771 RepID=A0AAV9IVN1_CYACA|nr:hypothetical protein CDCA_CDCA07G2163 [Cyanidium caldarium]
MLARLARAIFGPVLRWLFPGIRLEGLRLSLEGGVLELRDVDLPESVLRLTPIRLPFRIVRCGIGTLRVRIPWQELRRWSERRTIGGSGWAARWSAATATEAAANVTVEIEDVTLLLSSDEDERMETRWERYVYQRLWHHLKMAKVREYEKLGARQVHLADADDALDGGRSSAESDEREESLLDAEEQEPSSTEFQDASATDADQAGAGKAESPAPASETVAAEELSEELAEILMAMRDSTFVQALLNTKISMKRAVVRIEQDLRDASTTATTTARSPWAASIAFDSLYIYSMEEMLQDLFRGAHDSASVSVTVPPAYDSLENTLWRALLVSGFRCRLRRHDASLADVAAAGPMSAAEWAAVHHRAGPSEDDANFIRPTDVLMFTGINLAALELPSDASADGSRPAEPVLVSFQMTIEKLPLQVSPPVLQTLVSLSEYLTRWTLRTKHRHRYAAPLWRPDRAPRPWWRYALRCVSGEMHRRRAANGTLDLHAVQRHAQLQRLYFALYRAHLYGHSCPRGLFGRVVGRLGQLLPPPPPSSSSLWSPSRSLLPAWEAEDATRKWRRWPRRLAGQLAFLEECLSIDCLLNARLLVRVLERAQRRHGAAETAPDETVRFPGHRWWAGLLPKPTLSAPVNSVASLYRAAWSEALSLYSGATLFTGNVVSAMERSLPLRADFRFEQLQMDVMLVQGGRALPPLASLRVHGISVLLRDRGGVTPLRLQVDVELVEMPPLLRILRPGEWGESGSRSRSGRRRYALSLAVEVAKGVGRTSRRGVDSGASALSPSACRLWLSPVEIHLDAALLRALVAFVSPLVQTTHEAPHIFGAGLWNRADGAHLTIWAPLAVDVQCHWVHVVYCEQLLLVAERVGLTRSPEDVRDAPLVFSVASVYVKHTAAANATAALVATDRFADAVSHYLLEPLPLVLEWHDAGDASSAPGQQRLKVCIAAPVVVSCPLEALPRLTDLMMEGARLFTPANWCAAVELAGSVDWLASGAVRVRGSGAYQSVDGLLMWAAVCPDGALRMWRLGQEPTAAPAVEQRLRRGTCDSERGTRADSTSTSIWLPLGEESDVTLALASPSAARRWQLALSEAVTYCDYRLFTAEWLSSSPLSPPFRPLASGRPSGVSAAEIAYSPVDFALTVELPFGVSMSVGESPRPDRSMGAEGHGAPGMSLEVARARLTAQPATYASHQLRARVELAPVSIHFHDVDSVGSAVHYRVVEVLSTAAAAVWDARATAIDVAVSLDVRDGAAKTDVALGPVELSIDHRWLVPLLRIARFTVRNMQQAGGAVGRMHGTGAEMGRIELRSASRWLRALRRIRHARCIVRFVRWLVERRDAIILSRTAVPVDDSWPGTPLRKVVSAADLESLRLFITSPDAQIGTFGELRLTGFHAALQAFVSGSLQADMRIVQLELRDLLDTQSDPAGALRFRFDALHGGEPLQMRFRADDAARGDARIEMSTPRPHITYVHAFYVALAGTIVAVETLLRAEVGIVERETAAPTTDSSSSLREALPSSPTNTGGQLHLQLQCASPTVFFPSGAPDDESVIVNTHMATLTVRGTRFATSTSRRRFTEWHELAFDADVRGVGARCRAPASAPGSFIFLEPANFTASILIGESDANIMAAVSPRRPPGVWVHLEASCTTMQVRTSPAVVSALAAVVVSNLLQQYGQQALPYSPALPMTFSFDLAFDACDIHLEAEDVGVGVDAPTDPDEDGEDEGEAVAAGLSGHDLRRSLSDIASTLVDVDRLSERGLLHCGGFRGIFTTRLPMGESEGMFTLEQMAIGCADRGPADMPKPAPSAARPVTTPYDLLSGAAISLSVHADAVSGSRFEFSTPQKLSVRPGVPSTLCTLDALFQIVQALGDAADRLRTHVMRMMQLQPAERAVSTDASWEAVALHLQLTELEVALMDAHHLPGCYCGLGARLGVDLAVETRAGALRLWDSSVRRLQLFRVGWLERAPTAVYAYDLTEAPYDASLRIEEAVPDAVPAVEIYASRLGVRIGWDDLRLCRRAAADTLDPLYRIAQERGLQRALWAQRQALAKQPTAAAQLPSARSTDSRRSSDSDSGATSRPPPPPSARAHARSSEGVSARASSSSLPPAAEPSSRASEPRAAPTDTAEPVDWRGAIEPMRLSVLHTGHEFAYSVADAAVSVDSLSIEYQRSSHSVSVQLAAACGVKTFAIDRYVWEDLVDPFTATLEMLVRPPRDLSTGLLGVGVTISNAVELTVTDSLLKSLASANEQQPSAAATTDAAALPTCLERWLRPRAEINRLRFRNATEIGWVLERRSGDAHLALPPLSSIERQAPLSSESTLRYQTDAARRADRYRVHLRARELTTYDSAVVVADLGHYGRRHYRLLPSDRATVPRALDIAVSAVASAGGNRVCIDSAHRIHNATSETWTLLLSVSRPTTSTYPPSALPAAEALWTALAEAVSMAEPGYSSTRAIDDDAEDDIRLRAYTPLSRNDQELRLRAVLSAGASLPLPIAWAVLDGTARLALPEDDEDGRDALRQSNPLSGDILENTALSSGTRGVTLRLGDPVQRAVYAVARCWSESGPDAPYELQLVPVLALCNRLPLSAAYTLEQNGRVVAQGCLRSGQTVDSPAFDDGRAWRLTWVLEGEYRRDPVNARYERVPGAEALRAGGEQRAVVSYRSAHTGRRYQVYHGVGYRMEYGTTALWTFSIGAHCWVMNFTGAPVLALPTAPRSMVRRALPTGRRQRIGHRTHLDLLPVRETPLPSCAPALQWLLRPPTGRMYASFYTPVQSLGTTSGVLERLPVIVYRQPHPEFAGSTLTSLHPQVLVRNESTFAMVVSTRSRATGDAAVSVPQQHTRPLRYASGSTQPGFWFERPFLYAGVVDEEVAAAAGETVSWSSSIPLEYDGEFTVRIVARRLRWTDHLGVQVMPDDGGSPAADGQAEEGVGGLAPADHPRLECLLRVRITSNELGQKVVVFADEQVVRPRFAIVNRTSCSVLYKWSFWRMQARYEQVPPHKTRVVCPGRPGPYHLIACLERGAAASGRRRRRRTRPRRYDLSEPQPFETISVPGHRRGEQSVTADAASRQTSSALLVRPEVCFVSGATTQLVFRRVQPSVDEEQEAAVARHSAATSRRLRRSDAVQLLLRIRVCRAAASLVMRDRRRQQPFFELTYASVSDVELSFQAAGGESSLQLTVGKMQCDNTLPMYAWPVVVTSTETPSVVCAARWTEHAGGRHVYEFTVRLAELHVMLDDSLLWQLLQVGRDALRALTGGSSSSSNNNNNNIAGRPRSVESTDLLAFDDAEALWRRLSEGEVRERADATFFNYIHVGRLRIRLSFKTSQEGAATKTTAEQRSALYSAGLLLTEVDGALILVSSFHMRQVHAPVATVMERVLYHIVWRSLLGSYNVVGGLSFLGDPVGLLSELREGTFDFFNEPVSGALESADALWSGFRRGTLSLGQAITFALTQPIAKLTGSAARGLGTASLNQTYVRVRARQERTLGEPDDLFFGLVQAMVAAGAAVGAALAGVFVEPVRGYRQAGARGFAVGLVAGLWGWLPLFVAAVLVSVSKLAEGMRNQNRVDRLHRARLRDPRVLLGLDEADGSGRPVPPYSEYLARGQQVLHTVRSGAFASERYGMHVEFDMEQLPALAPWVHTGRSQPGSTSVMRQLPAMLILSDRRLVAVNANNELLWQVRLRRLQQLRCLPGPDGCLLVALTHRVARRQELATEWVVAPPTTQESPSLEEFVALVGAAPREEATPVPYKLQTVSADHHQVVVNVHPNE